MPSGRGTTLDATARPSQKEGHPISLRNRPPQNLPERHVERPGDRRACGRHVFREEAAKRGFHPKHREVVAGDELALGEFAASAGAGSEAALGNRCASDDAVEEVVALSDFLEKGVGYGSFNPAAGLVDAHEFLRSCDGQQAKHEGMEGREDGGVVADSKS